MADIKKSWDDIPSIENLEVDWDYRPPSKLGKRAYSRLTDKDLSTLLGTKSIPAKVVSPDLNLTNRLADICQIGMAVFSSKELDISEKVKVGLYLNRQKILSNARVRNVTPGNNCYRIGLEFVGLNNNSSDYLSSLVASHLQEQQ